MAEREKKKQYQKQSLSSNNISSSGASFNKRSIIPFCLTFLISFATWLVLSGRFDLFHILLGVISSGIVGFISGDLLLADPVTKDLPKLWIHFLGYIPYLLYQIFKANIHVMYLAFHPNMIKCIDPRIIIFDSRLKSDMARFIFANSITLTPGTITVYVSIYGVYTVHAIDKKSADSLPGEMEKRVARIFGD